MTDRGTVRTRRAVRWLPLCIPLLALLLMAPEIAVGPSYNFSIRYNLVWADQFTRLLGEGVLYPRWLPHTWGGLGSPTFYFYSPLFFFGAGLIGLMTGAGTGLSLSLASALFLALSGYAMRAWLGTVVQPAAAWVGTFAYLLAPYRLHDIYTRGALAEATTYLALPLVLLGLARIKARGAGSVPLLAVAYALLIFGHLPVALLASVTLVPAYALWQGRVGKTPDWTFLIRAAGAGLLGLALAAIFILPAIMLLPHVSAEQLFSAYFSPESWFFFTGPNSVFAAKLGDGQLVTVLLSTGYAGIAVAALVGGWRDPAIRFWAGLGLACYLLVSGLLPFVWDLPVLRQVQFPSRLLAIIECVTVTLLVLAWGRMGLIGRVVPLVLVAGGSAMVLSMAHFRIDKARTDGAAAHAAIFAQRRDAAEFLPNGHPMAFDDEGRADPGRIALPVVQEIVAGSPDARVMHVATDVQGGIVVDVTSKAATTLTVRRYAFPHWQVRDGKAAIPIITTAEQLVSWRADAGVHRYRLEAGWAPFERTAMIVSLVSFLLILVSGLLALRPWPWLTRP